MNRASRKDHGGRQGCHCLHVACAFVLLIAVQSALAPAYAQNSLLTQARAHMADGNPQAAYEVLTPHESSLAGDPGFDYLLGIAAMDSGHLTHSVFALERVLAVQPDNVLARAEIARVYLMLGELRTSRQEFEAVRSADDLPPAARNTVERYLTAFRATPEEGADFKGFLAVTVGWDSNVNAASDISSVAIPGAGGAIFILDPAAREVDDVFTTIAGGASVSFPLTDSLRVNAPNDFTFPGSGPTTNSTSCISVGCTTFVEGFFAGNDGSHAGLAYKTQISGDYINGAAAFKKD